MSEELMSGCSPTPSSSSFVPCAVIGLDARKIDWWMKPYEDGTVKINPEELAAFQALLRPQRDSSPI